MAAALTLVSHKLCPYVQRAAIALSEKQVSFERVDIDLGNKPDWFLAVSPLGKVPVLRVRDGDGASADIFESSVILEYLEETQPGPLFPAHPLERARQRAWVEFGSQVLNAISRFYSARDAAAFEQERGRLRSMFETIEGEITGPWFSGETFSVVDCVFAPAFRYFDAFDRAGDFGILTEMPAAGAWRKALAQRASVRTAVVPDYPDLLLDFLLARGSILTERLRAAGY